MAIFSKYKIYFIIFTLILISITCSLLYYYKDTYEEISNDPILSASDTNEENNIDEMENELTDDNIKLEPATYYKIDIKGAIKKPGVYSVEENNRIIDVINQAGGLNKNANTTYINLSKKIFDEMVIVIYTKEQVADIKNHLLENKQIIENLNKENKNDALIENSDVIENTSISEENKEEEIIPKLISINSATKEELITLTGIGEKKASDIIDYRKEQGPFEILEDLMNVSGIGEALFAKIKDYITL